MVKVKAYELHPGVEINYLPVDDGVEESLSVEISYNHKFDASSFTFNIRFDEKERLNWQDYVQVKFWRSDAILSSEGNLILPFA